MIVLAVIQLTSPLLKAAILLWSISLIVAPHAEMNGFGKVDPLIVRLGGLAGVVSSLLMIIGADRNPFGLPGTGRELIRNIESIFTGLLIGFVGAALILQYLSKRSLQISPSRRYSIFSAVVGVSIVLSLLIYALAAGDNPLQMTDLGLRALKRLSRDSFGVCAALICVAFLEKRGVNAPR